MAAKLMKNVLIVERHLLLYASCVYFREVQELGVGKVHKDQRENEWVYNVFGKYSGLVWFIFFFEIPFVTTTVKKEQ